MPARRSQRSSRDCPPGHFPWPLRLRVVTWNQGGLSHTMPGAPLVEHAQQYHAIVVGVQESTRSMSASMVQNSKSAWLATITAQVGPQFLLGGEVTLTAMHLAMFIRTDVVPYFSFATPFKKRTGLLLGLLGNKGGIGLSFSVDGMSVVLLNVHLHAGVGSRATARRALDVMRLARAVAEVVPDCSSHSFHGAAATRAVSGPGPVDSCVCNAPMQPDVCSPASPSCQPHIPQSPPSRTRALTLPIGSPGIASRASASFPVASKITAAQAASMQQASFEAIAYCADLVIVLGDLNCRPQQLRYDFDDPTAPQQPAATAEEETAEQHRFFVRKLEALWGSDQAAGVAACAYLRSQDELHACVAMQCDDHAHPPDGFAAPQPKYFTEGNYLSFKPTYKRRVHGHPEGIRRALSDLFETSRVPWWTDRIIFAPTGCDVAVADYSALEGIQSSDHVPVTAELVIKPL